MPFGLVHPGFSLPQGQAGKLNFLHPVKGSWLGHFYAQLALFQHQLLIKCASFFAKNEVISFFLAYLLVSHDSDAWSFTGCLTV